LAFIRVPPSEEAVVFFLVMVYHLEREVK
jgi:hypothetical protein